MLETSDLILRSAAAGVCFLLIVQFISVGPLNRKTVSVVAMATAVIAMIICSSPVYIRLQESTQLLQSISFLVGALHAPIIAWALLEVFEDDFQIEPWQTAFLAVTIPSHFLQLAHPAFVVICNLSSIAIYAYLFYVACVTRGCDLVWSRREFRKWFMSAIALVGIGFTVLNMLTDPLSEMELVTQAFKSAVILLLGLIFTVWATKVRTNLWAHMGDSNGVNYSALSIADNALLRRLESAMENGAWRQEGLTIRALAEQLDTQEHRLRRVINQGLGYRNFTAFLNERRIQAACQVLADPERVETSVLTVAYDVGYASLGPFNRAFKELTGTSPTKFRKQSVVFG